MDNLENALQLANPDVKCLKVSGFKNLVDVDVRFGPFTCIAGANGVGKSNLFDAIRFLSLTANHSLLEAALRVRDETAHNTDVSDLFHRVGSNSEEKISFAVEMIVPLEEIDDLGQAGKAAITFLEYKLVLQLRKGATNGSAATPFEIIEESLTHITKKTAHSHILFPHDVKRWRDRVITGRRSGANFISTEPKNDGSLIIKLHQDGGKGRAYDRLAATAAGLRRLRWSPARLGLCAWPDCP